MLSRPIRRRIAGSLLCVMLFAQAALAAAACDLPASSPVLAFTQKTDAPSCHEAPERNANLCLTHCLSSDQSADIPKVDVPALVAGPVLIVPIGDVRGAPNARQRQRHALPRPAAPPPRILFQSFLI
jgi:hypothetical protein